MTLAYNEELRDRVGALLQDVGPLYTVSGLGFSDDDGKKVGRAVEWLARGPWRLIDLRGVDAKAAKERLLGELSHRPEALVVLAAPKDLPRPLIGTLRAFIDKNAEIDFGDHSRCTRPDRASVVVVCDGAKTATDLDRELQRVPYWDFVP